MYKINNISLSTYNIIAGRAPNSMIAMTGVLDMPKRTGKTFHSWGDHHGVEPYVSASEIFFAGRELAFYGLVKAEDRPSAVYLLKGFYKLLNGFSDLVPFETPYGTFQVYLKEEIKVSYLSDGWCQMVLKLQERIVSIPTPVLPIISNYGVYGIDGIPFKNIGAFVVSTDGNLNRPGTKKQSIESYGYEGYEITKNKLQKFKVNLVFQGVDFDGLKENVGMLHRILASEGLHDLNIDGTGLKIWAVNGFKVKSIREWVAELEVELLVNDLTSLYAEGLNLIDNSGSSVVDNNEDQIIFKTE